MYLQYRCIHLRHCGLSQPSVPMGNPLGSLMYPSGHTISWMIMTIKFYISISVENRFHFFIFMFHNLYWRTGEDLYQDISTLLASLLDQCFMLVWSSRSLLYQNIFHSAEKSKHERCFSVEMKVGRHLAHALPLLEGLHTFLLLRYS